MLLGEEIVQCASDGVEKGLVDIWGTALAAYLNVSNVTQAARVFRFFKENEQRIFFEGQVRELLAPMRWSRERGKDLGRRLNGRPRSKF